MLTVVKTGEGVIELNYMWLPTWLGMNTGVSKPLEDALRMKWVGAQLTNEVLYTIHLEVIAYLVGHYRIPGLEQYLRAIEMVDETGTP